MLINSWICVKDAEETRRCDNGCCVRVYLGRDARIEMAMVGPSVDQEEEEERNGDGQKRQMRGSK